MIRHHRLAVTDEQKIFDKCDKLYPHLRYGRCCALCLSVWKITPADCIHHIIHRDNLKMRFFLPNLIPLCNKHHMMIHEGKITEPISEQHREKLQQMAQKDFKGMLIARGLTKAEYYQEQLEKIKENIL